jgi:hypothetical protein
MRYSTTVHSFPSRTIVSAPGRLPGDMSAQFTSSGNLVRANAIQFMPAHNTDLTVAFWFSFDSIPAATYQILSQDGAGQGGGAGGDIWAVILNGTSLDLYMQMSTGSAYTQLLHIFTPVVNTWYLGIFEWTNQASPRQDAWIYSTTALIATAGAASGGYLNAGATTPSFVLSGGTAFPMTGRVDKVGLWSTLLGSAARTALWNNGIGLSGGQLGGGGLTTNLLAYYDVDEPAGTENRADYLGVLTLSAPNGSVGSTPPAGLF